MAVIITEERPDSAEAVQLIDELEATLAPHYPVKSRHGYSVEKLLRESVVFFIVRHDDTPAGCGGVQFFGDDYAELKRMYVRPRFRGLGLGKLLVEHFVRYSVQRGVTVLRLETGIYQVAAIGLYEQVGFQRIAPFGDYEDDPLSVFFEKCMV
ncbi:MAG: GNAT family N-acetyltransferase [Anaerolineae bacterium]